MNLAGITAKARTADCSECGAMPGVACEPADVIHMPRLLRARRQGQVTDAELMAVWESMIVFTLETPVPAALRRAA